MIEINLLPEERRGRIRPSLKLDFETGRVKLIAGGVVAGVLISLVIFLAVGTGIRKKQIRNLMAKEQNLAPERSKIEVVNKDMATLKAKVVALDKITKRRFLWAEKLNQLSDLILPGIWYTSIRSDSENRLVIEGSVISKKEEAMASVGKYMKNLRENKAFFKDFSNIKLTSVQRKNIGEKDVVDFKIVLYFK